MTGNTDIAASADKSHRWERRQRDQQHDRRDAAADSEFWRSLNTERRYGLRRVEDRLGATAAVKQPDSATADETIDLTYSLYDLDEKQINARRKALRSLAKRRFPKA